MDSKRTVECFFPSIRRNVESLPKIMHENENYIGKFLLK